MKVSKWLKKNKLLAIGAASSLALLIKTENMTVGPAGMRKELRIPMNQFPNIHYGYYAEQTPTQQRDQMFKPWISEWGNMNNTEYVIPISGPTVNSPSLESLLQTEWSMSYPSAGEWYGPGTVNFLNKDRKEVGHQYIELAKYGWVSQDGDYDLLAMIYALRYAESVDIVSEKAALEAAYNQGIKKKDYWWR